MRAPSSREVYQCLRDVAMGVEPLQACARPRPDLIEVSSAGWQLSLIIDHEGLAHCASCCNPQGVSSNGDSWQRYGTNPVELLSIWERRQIELLLGLDS